MDEKTLELLLAHAKDSYAQERTRADLLLTKSHNLIVYAGTLFGILNAVAVFLEGECFGLYVICGCLFLLAIIFGVRAQLMEKGLYFPSAWDMAVAGQGRSEMEFELSVIRHYHESMYSLTKANDHKAKLLKRGQKFLLVGLVALTLFVAMIVWRKYYE